MAIPHKTAPTPNLVAAVELPARRGQPSEGDGDIARKGGDTIHGRRVNTRRTVAAVTEDR
jgi:hypothetical protein